MAHIYPLQPGDEIQGADQPDGLFRPGSPAPDMDCHPAPLHTAGDNAEQSDVTHEINIDRYGDGYDPRSVVRVRNAPWSVDTDHDGERN